MTNFKPRGTTRRPARAVVDTRKPMYMIFILDTSSSMTEYLDVAVEGGNVTQVRKIDELNRGLNNALNSLRRFEAENVLYKVYFQIIELNSYGKALYPNFVALSDEKGSIKFDAAGVTCLENSLNTLRTFLDPKHLPGCNRAVNVILMSDGYPTDVTGRVQPASVYRRTIEDFESFLEESGLEPSVDLHAIGVGNACKEMLVTFADEGKYYEVEEMESLAHKLDFVTRMSLSRLVARRVSADDPAAGSTQTGIPDSDPTPAPVSDPTPAPAPAPREVDVTKCLRSSCLACLDACKLSAIRFQDGLVSIWADQCVGCGSCESLCPVGAIQLLEE